MPVRQFKPKTSPERSRLITRLAREWRSPNSRAKEPVIIEEPDRQGKVTHVYVVWSDWVELDRVNRGEIILDAAEKIKSRSDLLDITVAIGLTPEEADRFQLNWR